MYQSIQPIDITLAVKQFAVDIGTELVRKLGVPFLKMS